MASSDLRRPPKRLRTPMLSEVRESTALPRYTFWAADTRCDRHETPWRVASVEPPFANPRHTTFKTKVKYIFEFSLKKHFESELVTNFLIRYNFEKSCWLARLEPPQGRRIEFFVCLFVTAAVLLDTSFETLLLQESLLLCCVQLDCLFTWNFFWKSDYWRISFLASL